MNDQFSPPIEILNKYAQVLVNFALGNDEGIKAGEVVQCIVPDVAKPLAHALHNEIIKAGGHVMIRLIPTGFSRDFYQLANLDQLQFFPNNYLKSRVKLIDHSISIIADPDPFELQNVDPHSIMTARDSQSKYRDWLFEKETKGKFTWTLGLWGTQAKADIVGLSIRDYWQQIYQACFLEHDEPVVKWREIKQLQQKIRDKLNSLSIEWLRILGEDVDLNIQLGHDRIWKGGADRNIPSFELFTSPNWRGTSGWIKFNQPVYRYGNIISGIKLEFQNGKVTRAIAQKGQPLLDTMLKSKNANKLGEFSLTDNRLSPITHFMAETLYDENMGGPNGNTHIAIGSAYRDCYRGNQALVKKSEWKKMGFNDSPEHTDIVSTSPRTVTATLSSGEKINIYQNGRFVI